MRFASWFAGAWLALVPALACAQVQPTFPSAGQVYAGPTSGSPAQPTFRSLVGGDLAVPFTQSLTVSSNLATVAGFGFNPIAIGLLATDSASCTCPTPGQNIPTLLSVQENFGGSNINNGRNALSAYINLTAPTAPGSGNPYRFYVAGNFYAQSLFADNGTGGSPQGTLQGWASAFRLAGAATNWKAAIAAEMLTDVETGASVVSKANLLLDNFTADTVQGSTVDTWIWTYAQTSSVGKNTWSLIDSSGGVFALTTTGTVIKLIGSNTIATGLDFGNLTISGNVLQWGNAAWNIAGSGNAQFNFVSAASINLGPANTFFTQGSHSTGTSTPTALPATKPGANNGVITWLSVTLGGVTQGWIPIWGN